MSTSNWNGDNRAPQPVTQFGTGYDVITTDKQATDSGANAYLSDSADNTHVLLTITAIETDLSLAGSRGQSQLQQDFYPRNFQQPSFTITCQARSQKEVGRVAEFVHKAQRNAVAQGALMSLIVPSGGLRHTRSSTSSGRPGMRGTRKGMHCSGYVKSMPRSHKRHDPAPTFSFDFVVARMYSGVFQDQPYKVYKLATWSEIVDSVLKENFISPPLTVDQEEQAEALREAASALKSIPFLGDLLGG
jgi:hypothetical protein